jgi:toxin FitB
MLLVDSNIIIYASKPGYERLQYFLEEHKEELAASAISMVETLSFQLKKSEKRYIELFFENIQIIPVSQSIIDKAKRLQEDKKVSAADAIIATTAIDYNAKLITNNTVDFLKVGSLVIINPLDTIEKL